MYFYVQFLGLVQIKRIFVLHELFNKDIIIIIRSDLDIKFVKRPSPIVNDSAVAVLIQVQRANSSVKY